MGTFYTYRPRRRSSQHLPPLPQNHAEFIGGMGMWAVDRHIWYQDPSLPNEGRLPVFCIIKKRLPKSNFRSRQSMSSPFLG